MSEAVTMEWLMEDAIYVGAGLSLARMTVAVGATSELHHHTNCSETIHLLSGEIEQRIGDQWLNMKPNETCLIPKSSKHQTRNIGRETAIMIVAYSAGQRVYIRDE